LDANQPHGAAVRSSVVVAWRAGSEVEGAVAVEVPERRERPGHEVAVVELAAETAAAGAEPSTSPAGGERADETTPSRSPADAGA